MLFSLRASTRALLHAHMYAYMYAYMHTRTHTRTHTQVFAHWLNADPAVAKDVLSGVCTHLKLHPYGYGTSALKLLGKLGGHNQVSE